jgi:hypothetical protein
MWRWGGHASTTRPSSSPTRSTSGRSYTSKNCGVPPTVTVPPSLDPSPTSDTPTFLTWEQASPNEALRFLLPVVVYRPGQTSPSTPPADYLSYLRSQARQGAEFTDEKKLTVDGNPAVVMTATTEIGLDGSLGCPATNMSAHECYGLSPNLALRIAVLNVHGKTLLAWARTPRDANHEAAFFAEFDTMLQSLKFA